MDPRDSIRLTEVYGIREPAKTITKEQTDPLVNIIMDTCPEICRARALHVAYRILKYQQEE
jgi:hypothetical protein